MNTQFQFKQIPAVQATNLYQEPSAGTHFFVRKDSMPFAYRTGTPFLSTGNFDSVIENKDKPSKEKTFQSCGNFGLAFPDSESDPALAPALEDFRGSKFGAEDLQHSQQNVKYNLNNECYTSRSQGAEYPQMGVDGSFRPPNQDLGFHQAAIPNGYQYFGRPAFQYQEPLARCDNVSPESQRLNRNSPQQLKLEHSGGSEASESDKGKDLQADSHPLSQTKEMVPIEEPENPTKPKNQGSPEPRSETQGGNIDDLPNNNNDQAPLGHLFETIKENCLSKLLNKKVTKKQEDVSVILDDLTPEIKNFYSLKELFNMCLFNKEKSIQVQAYLKLQTPQDLDHIAKFFLQYIDQLVFNKFGNYVVQFLIEIHLPSREYMAHLTLENFVGYAENEYGSRIMQKLGSLSSKYCYEALGYFYKNFNVLIRNITGSILLSKLISTSRNEQDYMFAVHILEKNKDYLRKAYFNRMLSTLVSCCSLQVLDTVVGLIKNHIWTLMNDKFGNYVLQIILERSHQQGTNLIRSACLKNSDLVLTRKYPKFLIIKILELDADQAFSVEMMKNLVKLDNSALFAVMEKKDSSSLLLLVLTKQPQKLIPEAVDHLLSLLEAHLKESPSSNQKTQEHCKID